MKSSLTTEILADKARADKAGADKAPADKARADKISATARSAHDEKALSPDNAPGGKTIAIFNRSVLLIRRCLD
jgi:hypothetical protein